MHALQLHFLFMMMSASELDIDLESRLTGVGSGSAGLVTLLGAAWRPQICPSTSKTRVLIVAIVSSEVWMSFFASGVVDC